MGPHLDAIASGGLRLRSVAGEVRHRLAVAVDAAALPAPELAVVCVKSQDLAAAAQNLQPWLDKLSTWECFDTGLPITQARGQARRAAENFRFLSSP